MNKKLIGMILIAVFLLVVQQADAQCAMCRAVIQSEADNSTAKGINNGIIYLMAIPYILVGGVLYFVYKSVSARRKE